MPGANETNGRCGNTSAAITQTDSSIGCVTIDRPPWRRNPGCVGTMAIGQANRVPERRRSARRTARGLGGPRRWRGA